MTIEKLGGIEPFKNVQNTQQTQRTVRARTSDSINLSPVAQKSMEVHLAMEAVKAAPDVRREKIEEVSKKLQYLFLSDFNTFYYIVTINILTKRAF